MNRENVSITNLLLHYLPSSCPSTAFRWPFEGSGGEWSSIAFAAFAGCAAASGLAACLRRTKMTAMKKKYEHPLRQVIRLRNMILGGGKKKDVRLTEASKGKIIFTCSQQSSFISISMWFTCICWIHKCDKRPALHIFLLTTSDMLNQSRLQNTPEQEFHLWMISRLLWWINL